MSTFKLFLLGVHGRVRDGGGHVLLAQEDQAPFEHIITTMDSLSSWKRVSRVCAGVQVLGGPQQFRHHLTRFLFFFST